MTLVLKGREAIVLGAGKSGRAAARLLADRGARVLLVDQQLVTVPATDAIGPDIHTRFGVGEFPLERADLVVVSPGIAWGHPQLVQARQEGVEVLPEVELAYRCLPANLPIAGITGTNGKSTTTALVGEMLTAAGLRPFVGGNLGIPLSAALTASREFTYQALVLELSSFQLEGVTALRAQAAAILNLTPDHQDRHPTLEAYAAAKARLFETQRAGDVAILDRNAPWAEIFARSVRGRLRTFGPGGDAEPTAEGFALAGRAFRWVNPALRGAHNQANAMAAALLAEGLGVGAEPIQRALESFAGLPHRLELVRILDGVEWINDSKATNVDSVAVALKALPGSLVWIAGGRGKGAPYAPLAPLLGSRLKCTLTIGEDGPRVLAELPERAERVGTLEAAVARARSLAAPGDTVLLSPGCASYDQFRNYEERGWRFRALVEAL